MSKFAAVVGEDVSGVGYMQAVISVEASLSKEEWRTPWESWRVGLRWWEGALVRADGAGCGGSIARNRSYQTALFLKCKWLPQWQRVVVGVLHRCRFVKLGGQIVVPSLKRTSSRSRSRIALKRCGVGVAARTLAASWTHTWHGRATKTHKLELGRFDPCHS